jgi:hypothetical protein
MKYPDYLEKEQHCCEWSVDQNYLSAIVIKHDVCFYFRNISCSQSQFKLKLYLSRHKEASSNAQGEIGNCFVDYFDSHFLKLQIRTIQFNKPANFDFNFS